jgi:hypothetical protein
MAGWVCPNGIGELEFNSGANEPSGMSPKDGFLFSKTATSKLSGISLRYVSVAGHSGHSWLGGMKALV